MQDKHDIKNLISMGESYTLQFKREFVGQDRIADEMVAFANSKGGTIIFGVEDKTGELLGLDYNEIQSISNLIGSAANEKVRPTIYVETYPEEIDGKFVLLTRVAQGISKPYKNLRGEIYVKQGADKRRITENREILRLFHDSRQYFPDEEAVSDTSMSDIYDKVIEKFLLKAYNKGKDDFGVPYPQLLKNLRILKPSGQLSLAGLLFFAEHPERYMPQFIVKAVAFNGTSLGGTTYRDSRDICGDLGYVYDECIRFCEGNLHHIQGDQSFNSLGQLEVSRIALEELIQNALTHRSYLIDAAIRLLIFDDRIEIVSPGTLAGDLTVESIKLGEAYQRNPLLSSFCARGMNYRGLGSGILRAIQDGAKLEFKNDDLTQQFTAILYRDYNSTTQNIDRTTKDITPNRNDPENSLSKLVSMFGLDTNEFGNRINGLASKFGLDTIEFGLSVTEFGFKYAEFGLGISHILILAIMRDKPDVTLSQIAEGLSMTQRNIEKRVAMLRDKHLVAKVGSKRYGRWEVVSSSE